MKGQEQGISSSLFLVRLWQSESKNAEPKWSGRVVHVTSGRAYGFPHLSALTALLIEILGQDATDAQKGVDRDEASVVATLNGGSEQLLGGIDETGNPGNS